MIESHVAALAGLRLTRFFRRERVACMAGIAGGGSEFRALLAQVSDLRRSLQANFVAASAAFLAFNHCHRLPVNSRHRLHCRPRDRVLALLVLVDLRGVTSCAGIGRRQFGFGYVAGRVVLIAVTCRAGNLRLAVLAQLPVAHNIRSDFVVAFDALCEAVDA